MFDCLPRNSPNIARMKNKGGSELLQQQHNLAQGRAFHGTAAALSDEVFFVPAAASFSKSSEKR